ncbi:MAG: M20/M25/M40 family metallo-hydrolase [Oscillospiraceae bacterium]|nr:M20/M25/M40 family metallo-hydrolase [Oscillospiraceae bacterium]
MIILYILLTLIVVLLAALLVNTAVQSQSARKLEGQHPTFTEAELEAYGKTFSRMLQPATVSVKDSYDDTEFAKLRAVVEEDFPLLHQKAERLLLSDDCWLYKIPGKNPNRNILLMSHHDVVAADNDWTMPAFEGIIRDGKVYGRGAADTKGSLCAILFAAEEMLRADVTPPVNFYIASSHNEELGGDGMPAILEHCRKNNIAFEVILDEGGAIVEPPLAGMNCEMCAMVAVHEKGRLKLKCTVQNESSHVSLTAFKGNPVERMSQFIQEITTKNIFIRRLHPETRSLFTSLAPYCKLPMRILLSNLWLFGGLLTKLLPKLNATAGGMVGTTCNFQDIQGSVTSKVCTASVMLRNINEEDLKADFAAFKAVADKHGVTLETERDEYYAPADMTSPAYRYTMDCIAKVFPRFPAAPYILPAGTDAWRLTPVCNCVLRFAPTRMSKQQLGSIHAADENLDISAIAEAAAFYKCFVENYQ